MLFILAFPYIPRRMTVKDVDGLSFAELLLLKSKLKEAVLTVKNHNEVIKLHKNFIGENRIDY